jgi:hypothetical protein
MLKFESDAMIKIYALMYLLKLRCVVQKLARGLYVCGERFAMQAPSTTYTKQ